ncbi:MAG: ribose-5-phosphate isomerase RpiA [Nitrospirae bacterium]|nr:ribose-5-phosphate isomerase RpiA [Nitrospirota bacterium]
MANEREKQAAARRSLAFVRDGYVVGLGSGSTASYAIRYIGERVREGLKIRGIPTSARSRDLALSAAIPLTTLEENPLVDVTIDGADEIDPALNLIKGGGGALLREKIIASASRVVVIIADSTKQVQILGRSPLPVEIVPFAGALLAARIAALGASVQLRRDGAGKPFVTDEGHHILDSNFGQIADPAQLAGKLDRMPGVAEHGLFLNMAHVVLVGRGKEVLELNSVRRDPPGPEQAAVTAKDP